MKTIIFFKNLDPKDWGKKVTAKWTVKDVLSHLVGWEREVTLELPKSFRLNRQPWFMLTDKYNNFNEKIYKEYKNYSPTSLLKELKKWEVKLEKEIKKIGKNKIKKTPDMDWVFDEGDEPHFEHHIQQIKKALKIKP